MAHAWRTIGRGRAARIETKLVRARPLRGFRFDCVTELIRVASR
jgi:hypothetical protein